MKKTILLLLGLSLIFSFSANAQYEVYVTTGNGLATSSVKKFDPNGNYLGDFISPGASPLNWPQDIVFIDNGAVALVSGLNNNAIFRFDGTTGALIDTFATNISGPTRMKIGPDGYLYALEWSGDAHVFRYDLTGNFIDTFTNIGGNGSIGLDWDTTGNLYVSSYYGNKVDRYDPSGNYMDTPISSGLSGPTTIWFDAAGDLFICNWNGNLMKRFDASFTEQPSNFGTISKPEGYTSLPNGDILLGSGGTSSSIRRYDSQRNFLDTFASGNGLANPNALYAKSTEASLDKGSLNQPVVYPSFGSRFYFTELDNLEQNDAILTSANGQMEQKVVLKETDYFDASQLADGVYFIRFEGGNSQKIIVKN